MHSSITEAAAAVGGGDNQLSLPAGQAARTHWALHVHSGGPDRGPGRAAWPVKTQALRTSAPGPAPVPPCRRAVACGATVLNSSAWAHFARWEMGGALAADCRSRPACSKRKSRMIREREASKEAARSAFAPLIMLWAAPPSSSAADQPLAARRRLISSALHVWGGGAPVRHQNGQCRKAPTSAPHTQRRRSLARLGSRR